MKKKAINTIKKNRTIYLKELVKTDILMKREEIKEE